MLLWKWNIFRDLNLCPNHCNMEIHLLDVGTREYGDCIIVHNDKKRILIDGAHKGDSALLKKQMKAIFGEDGPYHFDLLVVTHLHDDHIGCLPEMIKNGDITLAKSLLMNPVYRWKEGGVDTITGHDGFVDALLEEDHSFLSDDELEQFLADAAGLVDRYGEMIKALKNQGKVILFNGVDATDFSTLEKEFSSLGMKILGPTKKHLKLTQTALLGVVDTLKDFVASSAFTDSAVQPADRYRRLFAGTATDSLLVMDAAKNKGSINNESIILKFSQKGPKGWTAMLSGDMQFAVPEVAGLDAEMTKLLKKINSSGPFDFIKTSHHTSYNGLNEEMMDQWISDGTEFFGHSGGLYDPSHPEPDVLKALKEREDKIQYARTDRNGLIRVAQDENGELSMWITKGDVNNFAKNKDKPRNDDQSVTQPAGTENKPKPSPPAAIVSTGDSSQLQFSATIPENRHVRITIEIDGEKKN